MTITRVFNGILNPNQFNQTDFFTDAIGIFIIAPDTTDEIVIDAYLQVEVTNSENRVLKLTDDFRQDTVIVYRIPQEFKYTDLPMYLTLLPSFPINLEVWIIQANIDLNTINDKLDQQQVSLDSIEFQTTLNTISNILPSGTVDFIVGALVSLLTGSPVPLLPSAIGGIGNLLPLLTGV